MPSEPKDVTQTLAKWAASLAPASVPPPVRAEVTRTFVNWLGCAVGGATSAAAESVLRAMAPYAGPGKAHVPGRREKFDELTAALLSGTASHAYDFDDTHPATLIHPGPPIMPAVLAMAATRGTSGSDFLTAAAAGIEVACRIGLAVSPDHYATGWHITATTGVFGAAAAAGRLLRLSPQEMIWALGLASTEASGSRSALGTMARAFHAGHAARNGMTAALLAKAGLQGTPLALEGPLGFAQLFSPRSDLARATEALGSTWEATKNTYKPFACAVVLHPAVDACLQIRAEIGPSRDIALVEANCHPQVLQLAARKDPANGDQARVSAYHAIAVALARGEASPSVFTDAAISARETLDIRTRTSVFTDAALAFDAAKVTVVRSNGKRIERHVDHARGGPERPLTNDELSAKFLDQAAPMIGDGRAKALLKLAWDIETVPDMMTITAAAGPK